MKKLLAAVLAVVMLAGCSAKQETVQNETQNDGVQYVDTYASASTSRIPMVGEDFDAGIDELISISNDLATKAVATADGYVAPENAKLAQVMTVNPDGSVGISTIHAWKVEKTEDGAQVTVVMTDGQNIQNVLEEGTKCTIMAHASKYYMMHAKTAEVVKLEYSDEAFEEGLFNVDYSGAKAGLCEYTVTFDIYALEGSFAFMFD